MWKKHATPADEAAIAWNDPGRQYGLYWPFLLTVSANIASRKSHGRRPMALQSRRALRYILAKRFQSRRTIYL